jgi:hypothetical protein
MSLDKLQEDLDEIKILTLYVAQITAALDMIITKDCVSVMQFNLKDQNRPASPTLVEIPGSKGEPINWDNLGLPEELKKTPFLVFPGARLVNPPRFDLTFDLELKPELLIPILTHIKRKAEGRIKYLKEKVTPK